MPHISVRMLKVQGRPARVWRGGSGPALLLLHGGAGDARRHWAPVWERLAHSFVVAAPDLPGFGETAPLPSASFGAFADWVGELREVLGFPRLVLVGNSFGGGVARLYAAAHPVRVIRLILVNGGALPQIPGWARRLAALPRLGDWLLNFVARSQAESAGFARTMADLPHPQTPTSPTLVLWGERDRQAPLASGRKLAASLPGAAFRVIPDAGHLPQLEQPEQFVTILREFCGRGVGEAGPAIER
jgi:pimeloyl-ACP methyl ester carboxylesterase